MRVGIDVEIIDGETEEEVRNKIHEKISKEPEVWKEELVTKITKRKEFVAIMISIENEYDPLIEMDEPSIHEPDD